MNRNPLVCAAQKIKLKLKTLSVKTRITIIIAAVAVFTICALVTSFLFFIKAEKISENAEITASAVTQTNSVAETLKSADGDMQKASQLLRGHKAFDIQDDSLTLYYDENFKPASKSDSEFTAVASKERQGGYYSYNIKVFDIKNNEDKNNSEKKSLSASQPEIFYELSFKAVNAGGNSDDD
ncbi:MAG: hypothetical protein ACLSAO_07140 [Anaerovoracaceae bacterium]